MAKGVWIAGGSFGLLGVVAGTFGAHGVDLTPDAAETYEIGVRFQMYHALALLAVAAAGASLRPMATTLATWLFGLGILIFSGSLYVLSVSGADWLGMITPVGGICFLAGWVCLICGAWRVRSTGG